MEAKAAEETAAVPVPEAAVPATEDATPSVEAPTGHFYSLSLQISLFFLALPF